MDLSYVDKLIIKESIKIFKIVKKDVMSQRDYVDVESLLKRIELEMKTEVILKKMNKEIV